MSRIKETRVPQPITIGKISGMHAILLHGEHVKKSVHQLEASTTPNSLKIFLS